MMISVLNSFGKTLSVAVSINVAVFLIFSGAPRLSGGNIDLISGCNRVLELQVVWLAAFGLLYFKYFKKFPKATAATLASMIITTIIAGIAFIAIADYRNPADFSLMPSIRHSLNLSLSGGFMVQAGNGVRVAIVQPSPSQEKEHRL